MTATSSKILCPWCGKPFYNDGVIGCESSWERIAVGGRRRDILCPGHRDNWTPEAREAMAKILVATKEESAVKTYSLRSGQVLVSGGKEMDCAFRDEWCGVTCPHFNLRKDTNGNHHFTLTCGGTAVTHQVDV